MILCLLTCRRLLSRLMRCALILRCSLLCGPLSREALSRKTLSCEVLPREPLPCEALSRKTLACEVLPREPLPRGSSRRGCLTCRFLSWGSLLRTSRCLLSPVLSAISHPLSLSFSCACLATPGFFSLYNKKNAPRKVRSCFLRACLLRTCMIFTVQMPPLHRRLSLLLQ